MIINVEIGSFEELQDLCWSGASDVLNDVAACDKEQEFFEALENYLEDIQAVYTDTELNDLIRSDSDFLLEEIGIDPETRKIKETN